MAQTGLLNQNAQAFIRRKYQEECGKAIKDALERGVARQQVVLPTGSGKTCIFAHIPKDLGGGKMLVLAHREELLEQAKAKIQWINPDLSVSIEQAQRFADRDADVVVASVPTLGRKASKRIEEFSPTQFEYVVVDENHHSAAESYLRILRYFKPKLLLGVSATPYRGDGIALSNIFDEVTYGKTILDLIEEGEEDKEHGPYLSRMRGERIKTSTDIGSVSIRAGDFAEDQLAEAVNVDGRNSEIISGYEKFCLDKHNKKCTLFFCVDKAHAIDLAQQMRDRGHPCEAILGDTNKGERAAKLAAFADGGLPAITTVGIAIEGYDNPRIDCLVFARPTKSPLLHEQMRGRGTRPFPGKDYCLILDVVDNCGKHRPLSIGDAFGVRSLDFLGEDVVDSMPTLKKADDMGINIDDSSTIEEVKRKVDILEKVAKSTIYVETEAEAIDVFNTTAISKDVVDTSIFPWVKVGPDKFVLPMFDKTIVQLYRNALGDWKCSIPMPQLPAGELLYDCNEKRSSAPFKFADGKVKLAYPFKDWKAMSTKAKWRSLPPKESQITTLKRMGIKVIPSGITRGSASHLLNTLFNLKKFKKAA